MYGAQAAELIRELKRAAEHLLPYYNVTIVEFVGIAAFVHVTLHLS